MGKGAAFSALLHLAVIVLTVVGLPWLYNADEFLTATPIGIVSEEQLAQLQSKKAPAQRAPEQPKDEKIPDAPEAPPVAEPEPEPEPPPEPEPEPEPPPEPEPEPEPPPEPEPEPEPEAVPEPPAVQPEPEPEPQAVIVPEPQPEPEPAPVEPPKEQVAEAKPKPVPPEKPDLPKKKKEETKKKKEEPKKEQVAEDATSWLKNVEKKLEQKKKTQKQKTQPKEPQQAALPPDDYDGPPITEGERDMIRQQIEEHASVDPGMPGIEDMVVEVKVIMNPDGSVQNAMYDQRSSNGHPNWRIFAEACVRAVYKSSPLRMPPEKPYGAWKDMRIVFHGREMARL
jgi:outer membrane biosynthesis protein TonB